MVGDIFKAFKKSQSVNIGNPIGMHWGMGHYDRDKVNKLKGLSKGSQKGMTAAQTSEYFAREEAKGDGYVRTPLTSRYS